MKKSGKSACERPASASSATSEKRETGDESRNRKTYLNRLEDAELTKPPVQGTAKPPSHVELAQLAASLAKDASAQASAGELAGRALEIWNASVSAMFVEEMAAFVVKGVCIFDEEDWRTHCRALVALFDDAKGAVPGQSTSAHFRESNKQAQAKAGEAVAHLWRQKQRGGDVIRALFPAKSETEETRSQKLLALLEFAKKRVSQCDELNWAQDGNRLKACLQNAWEPLGFPSDDAKFVEFAAKVWMALPKNVLVSNLGASPVLARWLTVLRIEQAAEAKSRS